MLFRSSLVHRYFEAFYTRIYGSDTGFYTGSRPTVRVGDDRDGYAIKGSLFLGKGVQVGASLAEFRSLELVQKYAAYHAFIGNDLLWLQGELQYYPDKKKRAYSALGIKPFKGLWLKTEMNYQEEQDTEIFGTVDFFPRPHYQFTLSASERNVIFISHYYL